MEERRRPTLRHNVQRAVYLRDHGTCIYCFRGLGPREVTFDHLVPVSRGGPTTVVNLACACEACNTARGDMKLTVWLDQRVRRYRGHYQPVLERLLRQYAEALAEVTGIPMADRPLPRRCRAPQSARPIAPGARRLILRANRSGR